MSIKQFIKKFLLFFILSLTFQSCSKKDEQAQETCFDGIKNQNEADVDCGGICRPCPFSMSAKINGSSWRADTSKIKASYKSGSSEFSLSGNANNGTYPQINLIYLGEFNIGSHNLNATSSFVPNISSFVVFNSGTLTITSKDSHTNSMSGTFNFTSTDTLSNTVYNVSDGVFTNITYLSQ
jgi:hypothetical protein